MSGCMSSTVANTSTVHRMYMHSFHCIRIKLVITYVWNDGIFTSWQVLRIINVFGMTGSHPMYFKVTSVHSGSILHWCFWCHGEMIGAFLTNMYCSIGFMTSKIWGIPRICHHSEPVEETTPLMAEALAQMSRASN